MSVRFKLSGFHADVEATVSNVGTFMPNTFTMQELARMSLMNTLRTLRAEDLLANLWYTP